jgi:hypothetical protein
MKYVVTVRNNLVVAIEHASDDDGAVVPETTLEVGTQLADNYRGNGCIDGRYHFDNPQRARIFATLCLEFTRALIDRRLTVVKALRSDEEYHADDAGRAES